MDAETVQRLERLNARFYEQHAATFDRARQHPWPGWDAVVEGLTKPVRVLDAGCGAGRFFAYLEDQRIPMTRYVGVDRSRGLLYKARTRFPDHEWYPFDLLDSGIGVLDRAHFDLVVAFGVLHHIAGRTRRRTLLENLAAHVDPNGRLVVTVWCFAHEPRFVRRQVSWDLHNARSEEPIDVSQLEPGDMLLRWQNDGVRYCHQACEEEVSDWIRAVKIPLAGDMLCDGATGNLNRYLIFDRNLGR